MCGADSWASNVTLRQSSLSVRLRLLISGHLINAGRDSGGLACKLHQMDTHNDHADTPCKAPPPGGSAQTISFPNASP